MHLVQDAVVADPNPVGTLSARQGDRTNGTGVVPKAIDDVPHQRPGWRGPVSVANRPPPDRFRPK